ncbi:hypothetical protein Q5P01_003675 [Channa striata]|uniref:Uncharacterized protein n=1 Tax=Channa striata TaxID=64152 RepID=A0AA88NSV0_CHASR|nr:hypothetical protein Q5P01_003675 [Channa striata]
MIQRCTFRYKFFLSKTNSTPEIITFNKHSQQKSTSPNLHTACHTTDQSTLPHSLAIPFQAADLHRCRGTPRCMSS